MRAAKGFMALLLTVATLFHAALAEKTVTLSFLGDCTIGCEDRLMNKEYGFARVAEREGYAYFFREMLPLLSLDDLTVANFEGVLKSDAKRKANKTYCFRGLPEYAQILTLGSVEAVSLENNHTGDYGELGLQTTRDALLAAGVAPVTTAEPYLFEHDGVTVAVVTFYAAGFYAKRAMMAETVRHARELGADAVVCMVHAGQEYDGTHSQNQTLLAHLLIDAGADAVIGSHPHVLQGVEVYRQRNILYSIGNFVFGGNATVRSNETVVARMTLRFDDQAAYLGQQLTLYPANISGDAVENNYQPVLVQGELADSVYQRIDQDSVNAPAFIMLDHDVRQYAELLPE